MNVTKQPDVHFFQFSFDLWIIIWVGEIIGNCFHFNFTTWKKKDIKWEVTSNKAGIVWVQSKLTHQQSRQKSCSGYAQQVKVSLFLRGIIFLKLERFLHLFTLHLIVVLVLESMNIRSCLLSCCLRTFNLQTDRIHKQWTISEINKLSYINTTLTNFFSCWFEFFFWTAN